VKRNTSYLVGTAINPNLSYLLAVRQAASTAIPFNTDKIKTLQIKPKLLMYLTYPLATLQFFIYIWIISRGFKNCIGYPDLQRRCKNRIK